MKLETTSKRMKPVSVEAADESNRRVVTKAPAAPWKTLASLISINLMPYRDSAGPVPALQKLAVLVNYDSFTILPTLVDAYSAMVKRLTARFYSRVTRYGTGGFLKARIDWDK